MLSGLLPAYVLHRVGWSIIALPPLLLLVGLVQLAYCDLTRRLLPRTLVYALSGAVIVSGVIIAGVMHEWQRLLVVSLGGLAFFALFFVINLMNPRWMAFGDVRLSLVVGFGLAWVSPIALLEGFFLANLLAAVIGFGADRCAPGRARLGGALRFLPRPRRGPGARHLELGLRRNSAELAGTQSTFTLWASSPFLPVPMVNSTVVPSAMPRLTSPSTCEWCTKRSPPPWRSTNP